MIWEILLPCARVVEVEWSAALDGWFCPMHSGSSPCSHLSICKESRTIYLKSWRPILPYLPSNTTLFLPQAMLDKYGDSYPNAMPTPKSPTTSASRYKMSTHHRYATSKKNNVPDTRFSNGYLNPLIDTLFIASGAGQGLRPELKLYGLTNMPGLSGVQFLAIDKEYLVNHDTVAQGNIVSTLMKFRRLRTVSLVVGDPSWSLRRARNTLPTAGTVILKDLLNPAGPSIISRFCFPQMRDLFATACVRSRRPRSVKCSGKRICRGEVDLDGL